jgi:hypothetical protein
MGSTGDYTLADIERRLLESRDTGFRELIESRTLTRRWGRRPVGTVRLIPVSSLGNFAALGPDWQVSKIVGREPSHINVEVPLVAAIADICDLALSVLRQQADDARRRKAEGRRPISSFLARAGQTVERSVPDSSKTVTVGPGGVSINLREVVAFTLGAGIGVGKQLGRPAARLGRSMRRPYRRIRSKGLDGVKSDEAALFYVARAFRDRLAEFEKNPEYNECRLWSPGLSRSIGRSVDREP